MSEKMSPEEINDAITTYEQLGANPSCPKGTLPIHFACDQNKPDVVRELISRKADVNAQNESFFTPLHVICSGRGNVECAKLLLEAGANPNIKEHDDGMTPLIWAAAKANVELVKLLLAHGASTETRNNAGRTALDTIRINYAHSASDSKKEVIDILEKAGAKTRESIQSTNVKEPQSPHAGKAKVKKSKAPLSSGKKRLLTILPVIILCLAGLYWLLGFSF